MVDSDLGSGDWISLSEAAAMSSESLGSKKTEEDIMKAGYLEYPGLDERLKIYTFARSLIEIKPSEASDDLRARLPLQFDAPLTDEEKKAAQRFLNAGEVFELHWIVLEKLTLLREWATDGYFGTVIRAISFEEFSEWDHHPGSHPGDQKGYWTQVFDGIIVPGIVIHWDDLRIDRQELLVFLEATKSVRNINNDVLGTPAIVRRHGKGGKTPPSYVMELIKFLIEIGIRANIKGEKFDPDAMPGQKKDLLEVAEKFNAKLQVAESTFDGYISGLCKFDQGRPKKSKFYSTLFPEYFK